MDIFTCTYQSPLGVVVAAAQDNKITGLWFNNQKYFPENTERWITAPDYPVLTSLQTWLDAYFNGNKPVILFELNPGGSEFRQIVWRILREIPYGCTITYGKIAERIAGELGKTRFSAQAVGGAVGHNPVSILIPCHRVVGSDGNLTGYAGGLDKKRALLELESGSAK